MKLIEPIHPYLQVSFDELLVDWQYGKNRKIICLQDRITGKRKNHARNQILNLYANQEPELESLHLLAAHPFSSSGVCMKRCLNICPIEILFCIFRITWIRTSCRDPHSARAIVFYLVTLLTSSFHS